MGEIIQWFKATDVFKVRGKDLFLGPIPFRFDKSRADDLKKVKLLISHPKAKKDCLYKILGIESYALQELGKGSPVGFLVEET